MGVSLEEAEAQNAARRAQGNGDGSVYGIAMATHPDYHAAYDPNTMSMTGNLKSLMPQFDQGFNKYRDEALNNGPSAWLNMSRSKNALDMQGAKEKMALENAGQTASARDNLASIGGLSSGARERTAEQGQKNYMAMSQDLSRQGTVADMGLGVQDESNRIGKLQNLTGMEETKMNDWQNAKGQDVSNAMNENRAQNEFAMNMYNTQMTALAAQRQAEATENSGKK